ncbi:MAG TPA: hypothetical protein VKQ27_08665, partial [Acetobacteraceae bacterium]|nr:hypothetical protein [Acetobacteraceae bacterium]
MNEQPKLAALGREHSSGFRPPDLVIGHVGFPPLLLQSAVAGDGGWYFSLAIGQLDRPRAHVSVRLRTIADLFASESQSALVGLSS